MKLLSVLLGMIVCCPALGQDTPYEFRGARLGMSLSDLRKLSFPDIDGNKFHTTSESSSARFVCGNDRPPLSSDIVLPPSFLDDKRKFAQIGADSCSWEMPEGNLSKKAYIQVGHGGSDNINYTVYRAPDGVERLWKIDIEIPQSLAPTLLESLSGKFGKPTNINKTVVQNRMGANFEKFVATWANDVSQVELTQRASTLDKGRLIYTHTEFAVDYRNKWDELNGPPKL